MRFFPDSWGSEDLREYNQCHEPAGKPEGGRFCSTKGETSVGITSARPPGGGGDVTNRAVFQSMGEFEDRLKAIPGVSQVSVQPGLGAWEGGSEPTWVVSYRGNGEARKLLAETGKRFNQDAVLVLHGGGSDPVTEWEFSVGASSATRKAVEAIMADAGAGGWTWFKRDGKTLLRWVHVPQWSGPVESYQTAVAAIAEAFKAAGFSSSFSQQTVGVEIMEREGDHGYEKILQGA